MAYVKGQPFIPQFTDPATGLLMANGTIEFYLSGTSTPTPYYTDSNGTSGGTAVTLNSGGKTPTDIYFDTSVTYKIVVKDSGGNALDAIDPYTPNGAVKEQLEARYFDTMVEAVSSTDIKEGQVLIIKDRQNSMWDVISVGPADGFGVVSLTGTNLFASIRIGSSLNLKKIGAPGTGTDAKAYFDWAINYCDTNKVPLILFGEYDVDCSAASLDWKSIRVIGYGWKNSIINVTPPSSGNAMVCNSHFSSSEIRMASTVAKGGSDEPIGLKIRNCVDVSLFRINIDGFYFGCDFDSDDVDMAAWAASTAVNLGDERQHNGNIYSAGSTGTTGTNPLIHESGTVSDGSINWTFVRTIYDNNKNHSVKSSVFENADSTGFRFDGVYNSELSGNRASNCGDKAINRGDGFKVAGQSRKNRISNNTADNNGRDGFDTFDGLIDTIFTANTSEENGFYGFEFKGNYGGAASKLDDYVALKSVIDGNHANRNGLSGFSWHTLRNCAIGVNTAHDNQRYGHEITDVKDCHFGGLLGGRNIQNGVKIYGGVSPSVRNTFDSLTAIDNSWASTGLSPNYLGASGVSIDYPSNSNVISSVRSGNGTASSDHGNQAFGIGLGDELTISMTSGSISDFQIGEQLDFGTSGAIARFERYEGAKLYYEVVSGVPQNAETVTGAASGTAGTISSINTHLDITNKNIIDNANLAGNASGDWNADRELHVIVEKFLNNSGTYEVPMTTDSTRPPANSYPAGHQLWNSDDNAYNFTDGTVWRDATGATT